MGPRELVLHQIAEEFEAVWSRREIPVLFEFLHRIDTTQRIALAELLLPIDLEYRTRIGLKPNSDDYGPIGPDIVELVAKLLAEETSLLLQSKRPNENENQLGSDSAQDLEVSLTQDHSQGSIAKSRTIGPYKLIQEIGEGGMGTVWMAEQEKPIRRRVALKLIKAGFDSKQVIARFEAERHALALMDHPNIARILDGGLTESGRPFFVMELVKGVPITEYCDAHKLTPQQRLELFVPVCQAIQHAHQKGIIHRDIKPSNVLVALCDDKPVPKVIDFGLAKATGQALTEKTLNTGFNVVGTPQYMSPEQATFNQLDIDTRTDIYSLGALLYELLAGSPPFTKKELEKAGFLEILRMIREEDPPRPSTKFSSADASPSISANRGTEPKKLTDLLRNELDWIVMKSMEKDRNRRYETASGLAADICRYLLGEAVLAHPPSKPYRLKKFLRKNKGAMLAAALNFVALFAGIIGTTIGMIQANKRTKELNVISNFQNDMFAKVDPTVAGMLLTADVTAKFEEALTKAHVPEAVRDGQMELFAAQWNRVNATDAATELIDRTILRPAIEVIERHFKDQPVLDARLRQVLANHYQGLGLYDSALPLQERALSIHRRVLGEKELDTLISMNNLGTLLRRKGELNQAESLLRDALAKVRRRWGEDFSKRTIAINLGSVLQAQGKYAEAVELLAPIEAASREAFVESNAWRFARLLMNLGKARLGLREFDAAESNLAEAQPIFMQTRGPTFLETRECTQALVDLYTAWQAAEPDKGHGTKAAEWKTKLESLPQPEASESTPENKN